MRGSLWAKWDLHLHTPYSIVQDYGGEQNWPRFLDELESLDPAFKVLGVNDYWFLDGYERLAKDRAAGRLSNIDCLLPVIEMRLSHLAGANESLKKINLHVLFDPSVSADTIRSQFISALTPSLKVEQGEVDAWSGVVTKEALADLGQSIIDSAPEKYRSSYGPPLMTGFSNLTVDFNQVINALRSHYFENKHLLILGRAEWASIKWEAASAATKRDVINRCQLIFTAFEDTSKWTSRREELTDANVLSRIVDCSDAHYWSDSRQPNRIGNCETWMRTYQAFVVWCTPSRSSTLGCMLVKSRRTC